MTHAQQAVQLLIEDGEQVTLRQLFTDNEPEQWVLDMFGTKYLDIPLPVVEVDPATLLLHDIPLPDLADKASYPGRWRIVKGYMRHPGDPVVLEGKNVLDGHHRAMAAFLAKRPVRAVNTENLGIEEAWEQPLWKQVTEPPKPTLADTLKGAGFDLIGIYWRKRLDRIDANEILATKLPSPANMWRLRLCRDDEDIIAEWLGTEAEMRQQLVNLGALPGVMSAPNLRWGYPEEPEEDDEPMEERVEESMEDQQKLSSIIAYHASPNTFRTFDTSREGAHFGTHEQASNLRKHGLKKPKLYRLSIKNPLRLHDVGVWNNFNGLHSVLSTGGHITPQQADDAWAAWQRSDVEGWESLKKSLESHGYDGIIYKNEQEGEGDSYIAFRSQQIKPASARETTSEELVSRIVNLLIEGGPITPERLERVYSKLYGRAEQALRKDNPCQVKHGKKGVTCVGVGAGPGFIEPGTLCCKHCKHHDPTKGCRAEDP